MAGSGAKLGWKIVGTGSAVVAGIATRKIMTKTWTAVTGTAPPANPEHPEVTWPEAVSWAVCSGIAVAIARLLVTRAAASKWLKSTGSLPPGMEATTN